MYTKYDPVVAASITSQGQSIINKLAEQVDLLGDFTPTKIPGRYAGTISVETIEKFAALIVQECVGVITELPNRMVDMPLSQYNEGWRNGRLLAKEHIENHFGVK